MDDERAPIHLGDVASPFNRAYHSIKRNIISTIAATDEDPPEDSARQTTQLIVEAILKELHTMAVTHHGHRYELPLVFAWRMDESGASLEDRFRAGEVRWWFEHIAKTGTYGGYSDTEGMGQEHRAFRFIRDFFIETLDGHKPESVSHLSAKQREELKKSPLSGVRLGRITGYTAFDMAFANHERHRFVIFVAGFVDDSEAPHRDPDWFWLANNLKRLVRACFTRISCTFPKKRTSLPAWVKQPASLAPVREAIAAIHREICVLTGCAPFDVFFMVKDFRVSMPEDDAQVYTRDGGYVTIDNATDLGLQDADSMAMLRWCLVPEQISEWPNRLRRVLASAWGKPILDDTPPSELLDPLREAFFARMAEAEKEIADERQKEELQVYRDVCFQELKKTLLANKDKSLEQLFLDIWESGRSVVLEALGHSNSVIRADAIEVFEGSVWFSRSPAFLWIEREDKAKRPQRFYYPPELFVLETLLMPRKIMLVPILWGDVPLGICGVSLDRRTPDHEWELRAEDHSDVKAIVDRRQSSLYAAMLNRAARSSALAIQRVADDQADDAARVPLLASSESDAQTGADWELDERLAPVAKAVERGLRAISVFFSKSYRRGAWSDAVERAEPIAVDSLETSEAQIVLCGNHVCHPVRVALKNPDLFNTHQLLAHVDHLRAAAQNAERTLRYAMQARQLESLKDAQSATGTGDVGLVQEGGVRTPTDEQLEAQYDHALSELPKQTRQSLKGISAGIDAIRKRVATVAQTPLGVLILGERGTGKELVARAIHDQSHRKGQCVVVNIAELAGTIVESELFGHKRGAFTWAISDRKGLMALADGGTLFIDEVGDVSLSIQAQLLRPLEVKEVKPVGANSYEKTDFRLVSATNKQIETLVRTGVFREDFYDRLSHEKIEIPPLRQRKEDILLLVAHFIRECCGGESKQPPRPSPQAMRLLLRHDWPGNVRELKHAIERAVAYSKGAATIEPEHFPEAVQSSAGPPSARITGRPPPNLVRNTGGIPAIPKPPQAVEREANRSIVHWSAELESAIQGMRDFPLDFQIESQLMPQLGGIHRRVKDAVTGGQSSRSVMHELKGKPALKGRQRFVAKAYLLKIAAAMLLVEPCDPDAIKDNLKINVGRVARIADPTSWMRQEGGLDGTWEVITTYLKKRLGEKR